MKKGLSLTIISLLMVLLLSLVGCSQTQQKSSNDQQQATDKEGPKTEENEPFNLDIYTFENGTSTYTLGVGLADLINKNSQWLKAQALESPGATQNTMLVVKEQDKRGKSIGFMVPWEAKKAFPPFEEKYDGIKGIAAIGSVSNGFVTLDPNIKKLTDLSGKRVALGTNPSVARVDLPRLVLEKAGVKDVKLEYMTFPQGAQALLDKKIDALLSSGFALDPKGQKWVPNPTLTQIKAQTKVYYLSYDKKAFEEAANDLGYDSVRLFEIPAGGFGEDQTESWGVGASIISWSADMNLPDRVAKEIARIMAENVGKFKDYHALGNYLTRESIAQMGLPENDIHPGALEYYNEQGIKTTGGLEIGK